MIAFVKRLVLTAVALPAVWALSWALPGHRHLAMAVVVTLVMAAGAHETGQLLSRARGAGSRIALPAAAGTIPLAAYLEGIGVLPVQSVLYWLVLLEAGLLAGAVLAAERGDAQGVLSRLASRSLELLYPAVFGSFIVRIAWLEDARMHYILFFCLVFGNDMAAYAFGRLAGGWTRLHLKSSPAKTAVGFAAGFLVAVAVGLAFRFAFPAVYGGAVWRMAALGALVGLATIVGDLAESALKRSAGVKDSGAIMFGRGGILDSVDSLVLGAPVFYLAVRLLG